MSETMTFKERDAMVVKFRRDIERMAQRLMEGARGSMSSEDICNLSLHASQLADKAKEYDDWVGVMNP